VWGKAQIEAVTLARAVKELKTSVDRFAAQVPELEEKIKHMGNKVLDGLTELHAKELDLEWTTKANKDYKSQNSRLTKKLETKLPSLLPSGRYVFNMSLTPLRLTTSDDELNGLKEMVENVVAFFYPGDSSTAA
jgi:hypothetical protein